MTKVTKDEILTHWTIQETLLQSYRVIFITVQSIIFSIGAISSSMNNPNVIAFSALFVIGVLLLYYWYSICKARGYDVSYCQMALLKIERGDELTQFMTEFKQWQKNSEGEKIRTLKEFQLEKSLTRTRMEKDLPRSFFALWIFLGAVMVYNAIR